MTRPLPLLVVRPVTLWRVSAGRRLLGTYPSQADALAYARQFRRQGIGRAVQLGARPPKAP